MSDQLKEESQKGPLDHLASTAQTALAFGAGAVFLYRGGGSKVLAEGTRISSSVLSNVRSDLIKLNRDNLGFSDLKEVYNKTFNPEGYVNSAMAAQKDKMGRIRLENPRNVIHQLSSAVTRVTQESQATMIRSFYIHNGVTEQVLKYQNLAKTPEQKARLNSFMEQTFFNPKDLASAVRLRDTNKLEDIFSNQQIEDLLKEHQEMRKALKPQLELHRKQFHENTKELEKEVFAEGLERLRQTEEKSSILLGDKSLSVKDFLDNANKFDVGKVTYFKKNNDGDVASVEEDAVTFLNWFREKAEEHGGEKAIQTFENLSVDKYLRKNDNGEIINLSETGTAIEKFVDEFSNTMPGKILKTRAIKDLGDRPSTYFSSASIAKVDPVLARLGNKEENKKALFQDSAYFNVYGKTFRLNTEQKIEHAKELDNTYLVGKTGTTQKLIMQIFGNESYRTTTGIKWMDKLGIGREGQPTLLDDFNGTVGKLSSPTSTINVIDDFIEPTKILRENTLTQLLDNSNPEKLAKATEISEKVNVLTAFYKKHTYAPEKNEAIQLSENMQKQGKRYMELASLENEKMLEEFISYKGKGLLEDTYHNKELASLITSYVKNPSSALSTLVSKTNKGSTFGSNQHDDFYDMLRQELAKEAFLTHAADNGGLRSIRSLIKESVANAESSRNLNRLADWSVIQSRGVFTQGRTREVQTVDQLLLSNEEAIVAITNQTKNDDKFFNEVRENLASMKNQYVSAFDTDYGEAIKQSNVVEAFDRQEYIHMQKAFSPLDMLKELNEGTKLRSLEQFVAGRNNGENVTNATMPLYFMAVRLSDALTKIGLGLGVDDKSDIGSLVSAMVFKRGLPLVGAVQAYSYTDDMLDQVTGTGISEAFLSGFANVDLFATSIADTIGLGSAFQTAKDINPFVRYWTGDEYLDREEKEDWYQNGYQEMRKGRWWSFGGIQEFRGSQVQYYQPNYLRRVTSDYKDVSLYNNAFDKWNSTYVPTPTNPLAPLTYALNPYKLENRFADERPYPMTGKMFTEETPWGPILNATVGEVIKPQRRMHADRLGDDYVDSKVLIEQENRAIMEKAKGEANQHLIRFKNGAIEAVEFTPYQAATASSITLGAYGETITNADYGDVANINSLDTSIFQGEASELETNYSGGTIGYQAVEGLSYEDKLAVRASKGGIIGTFSQLIQDNTAISLITDLNAQTFQQADANAKMVAVGKPTGEGVITTQSIYNTGKLFGSSVLEQAESLSELKGLSSGDDFLGEMAYTLRFATGIYGYGTHTLFPGGPSTKLADASDITSPVRGFWDANLGGLGGGYLEIFRRFIPSTNHMQENFNPLLNTMPDWIPERFRFGDPFSLLPKGEMRLPGSGYESLNDLHPDEYGLYGAFDRFKILADIAPTTPEYKVWRDIAQKTHPSLKQEIEEIKERVEKQNQKYEFFDYQFLGRGVDRENVYIDQILNDSYFTVVGSDEVYRLAGIELDKESGVALSDLLTSGSKVLLMTDKDEYSGRSDDSYNSISAAIYQDGENLNRQLIEEGYAKKRSDTSAAATLANYTDFQVLRGKAYEALSHLPVPYFSQKFFRIRDPLESWKQEMTYGTSYASWSRPIDSFLMPAIERSLMSDVEVGIGAASAVLTNMWREKSDSKFQRKLANGTYMLTNRGAFIGGFIGIASGLGDKGVRRLSNYGAIAQGIGWAYTRSDQPIEGTIGAAAIGGYVGHYLKKDVGILKGSGYGAAIGLAVTALNTDLFSEDKTDKWIPERTKEKWELQELFDRMNYIKYDTLYKKAASKAKRKEGVDIRELVDAYEENSKKNYELRAELEEQKELISSLYGGNDTRGQRLLQEIEGRIRAIESSEFIVSAGEYGKSALMYKQLADSTVYGLGNDASWAEMVRAIPQNEREHFLEFMKEKNTKKQKEILEYVSPYTAKVLKIAWGYDEKETGVESNASYFQGKRLPGPFWSGWRPDVDLKDVQVKTIQNEGMLLADFGYYESQLRDPEVANAPVLSDGVIPSAASLNGALRRMGLTGVNVNVMPTSKSGFEVVANIVDTAIHSPLYLEQTIGKILSY